jgi:hypothetical protein
MLDIQPKDKSIKNRNIIADDALNNAIKSKPYPLYKKEYASRNTQVILMMILKKIKMQIGDIEVVVGKLEK